MDHLGLGRLWRVLAAWLLSAVSATTEAAAMRFNFIA